MIDIGALVRIKPSGEIGRLLELRASLRASQNYSPDLDCAIVLLQGGMKQNVPYSYIELVTGLAAMPTSVRWQLHYDGTGYSVSIGGLFFAQFESTPELALELALRKYREETHKAEPILQLAVGFRVKMIDDVDEHGFGVISHLAYSPDDQVIYYVRFLREGLLVGCLREALELA